jgi:nicotinate-nucleotide adenylyltransferase
MKLGVLGGTFNPVHFGHLRAAEEVRQRVGLDRVLFIPSGTPPLKAQGLAPADMRLRMVQLAIASNPHFQVSDMEVLREGPSFTIDTVNGLRESYPEDDLFFILGADAFAELPKWYKPVDIVAGADFIIVGRPPQGFSVLAGSPFLRAEPGTWEALSRGEKDVCEVATVEDRRAVLVSIPELDISATGVRQLVRAGRSIKYLLPEDVELFIMSHGLYRDG